ncbi:RNA-binding protein cabeza-like [Anopheles arabiensis]|uniref:Hyaluronan/mRNA-binding protein domain-containing protein n=1 Tax=Anopheles arabiensis TaxID=7173 RepID=A0A182HKQ5_ANOAR|nr:RNA-binding protein cabeza-like [Anopheles arabiensis]
MENTSYGINVANRYDLFCIDDDEGDPIEAILKSKQKQQKKQQAQQQPSQQQGGAAAPAAQPQQGGKATAKGGEKENKAAGGGAGGGGRGAENRHPDKSDNAKHAQTNGTGNHLHNQRGGGGGAERRGIKETQKDNIRNQENQRGGTNPGAKFPRGPNKSGGPVGGGGEYPRKPREFDGGDGQRKSYAQNGGGAGGAGAGGVKRFDGRGKRELDRQSGSNKTGIKAVDKRDGAGSHNWGSSKQDAKEYSNNPDQDFQPQDADTSAEANAERTNVSNGGEEAGADGAAAGRSDDEAKEMTLDEWKAQKAAARLKPQYNLRKAGEGEDSSQWDKMVALDRKTNPKAEKGGNAGADGGEEDDGNDTHNSGKPAASGGGGGGKKQFLEIEYHFNDSRRGGLGRSRGGRGGGGRGAGGGRGMGREGAPGGGRREYGGGENNYRGGEGGGEGTGGGRYNNYEDRGGEGGERPQRDYNRRNNRPPMGGGPDRNYEGGMNNTKYSRPNPRSAKQHAPAAPKVDDEHDFPSLG